MKESVVADSTCLIALERIDSLEILPAIFESVWIPPAVSREFGDGFPWLKIESPTNTALVESLKLMVDGGEAEAIALAIQLALPVILDDRQARSVAKGMRMRVLGTLGCALKAKHNGAIRMIRPIIESLELKGFYLGTALKKEALRLAGE